MGRMLTTNAFDKFCVERALVDLASVLHSDDPMISRHKDAIRYCRRKYNMGESIDETQNFKDAVNMWRDLSQLKNHVSRSLNHICQRLICFTPPTNLRVVTNEDLFEGNILWDMKARDHYKRFMLIESVTMENNVGSFGYITLDFDSEHRYKRSELSAPIDKASCIYVDADI